MNSEWVDISKAALSFQATAKQPKIGNEDEGQVSETDTDEEDELRGPRYDKVPNATDSE